MRVSRSYTEYNEHLTLRLSSEKEVTSIKVMTSKNNKKSPTPHKPNNNPSKQELESKGVTEPANRQQRSTIVGIDASAGGLKTLHSVATAGLVKVRHRLPLTGSAMQVESQPAEATRVLILVPADQELE